MKCKPFRSNHENGIRADRIASCPQRRASITTTSCSTMTTTTTTIKMEFVRTSSCPSVYQYRNEEEDDVVEEQEYVQVDEQEYAPRTKEQDHVPTSDSA